MAYGGTAPVPSNNRFEQRAKLYNTMAEDQAHRIADAWGETAPGQAKPTAVDLRQMWDFTRSPDPHGEFWQRHDLTLQQEMAQIPQASDAQTRQLMEQAAHQKAEQTAMDAVYPYRAVAYRRDALGLEQAVKLANRIARIGMDGAEPDTQAPAAPVPGEEVSY